MEIGPIKIDAKLLGITKSQKQGGIDISVGLPPDLVPEAVVSSYDPEEQVLAIEFVYDSSNEDTKYEDDGPLRFVVGVNSQRLYGIQVGIEEIRPDDKIMLFMLKTLAGNALLRLANKCKLHSIRRHYEVTRIALLHHVEDLIPKQLASLHSSPVVGMPDEE
jgi:hypothetical protein